MDMKDQFSSLGDLRDIRIVMPRKEILGAETGSLFVEYNSIKEATAVLERMRGIKYENRLLELVYVKSDLYEAQFKAISESFKDFVYTETVEPTLSSSHPPGDDFDQLQFLSLIHISEPTRPLYISYAVFCLKKKKKKRYIHTPI
eukprot:TRINITY_DN2032_c0_g1_i1.p2 TRINITY_DN2032_c0_g1~~TRINITY_DN2032_c0_g1_i1.p2  ORF type:complete len:145 (-),score=33.21 TRINITY_DN2032_c0_g1_i1:62-496(-)